MAEQVEQEFSEDMDSRSPKKQRVDDDANEQDEQSLVHLSQEVERMTKTIEAVNGKLDDHFRPPPAIRLVPESQLVQSLPRPPVIETLVLKAEVIHSVIVSHTTWSDRKDRR
eukprot:g59235.t1